MELTNSTFVPAKLSVSKLPDAELRIGLLVAKATFKFDLDGRVEADTQEPIPLFTQDQNTPLGILPTDGGGRRGNRFEVMLLGHAYPPRPPATVIRVALAVGKERRELMVFGDRSWIGHPPNASAITQPRPFDKMPLVYERAFGGTVPAHLDRDSVIDIRDPINPRGQGFDAEPQARGLCQMLKAPQGFPVLLNGPRTLPNLEDPRSLIARWDDAPDPVGWGAAPMDTAIAHLKFIRAESAKVMDMEKRGAFDVERYKADAAARDDGDPDRWYYRAHPNWIIERPASGAVVSLENLLPNAKQLQFALPQLRIVADYTIAGRDGRRDLVPQVLVLLPEEKRFYLVYRLPFTFDPQDSRERAFRMRVEQGWPSA